MIGDKKKEKGIEENAELKKSKAGNIEQAKVDDHEEIKDSDDKVRETEPEKVNKEVENKINELKNEVKGLKLERDNYFKQLQRLQADFINFRERTNREKKKISFNAKIDLIDKLLPVIDNFERALASVDEDNDFVKGIDLIYRQVMNLLEKEGIKVIASVGEPFDPNLHEAIMQVEDTEYESGIITEEIQKGYIFTDKVIRPTKVKVAK